MSAITPTMKLITCPWQGQKSFRLMPVSKDCPYTEGLYDPNGKVLVLISVLKKESFHMVQRLDDDGHPIPTKDRKNAKQERKLLETFTEYYITEKVEIEEAIKDHAVNADTFDFATYLNASTLIAEVEKPKIELINKD